MKLIQILITITITITLTFLISMALDSDWVARQLARQIIIYLSMMTVCAVGFLVCKEILK